MIKQVRSIMYLVLCSALFGCNSVSTNDVTISAAATGCTNATQNSCQIVLTYNTQGASLTLAPNGNTLTQFTFPLNACTVTTSNTNQTCTLNVTYKSTGQIVSENVTFVLSGNGATSVTSNAVTLSGS